MFMVGVWIMVEQADHLFRWNLMQQCFMARVTINLQIKLSSKQMIRMYFLE